MTQPQASLSSILSGPYGLRAFAALLLVLLFAFLWVFNFTSFF